MPTDIPGYNKLNAYRVWGNMLRVSQDYNFGWVSGQLRVGVWWEGSATQRYRGDFDMTLCSAQGIQNAFYQNATSCIDYTLVKKGTALIISNQGNPTYNGADEYVEHSNWDQYQPFAELDIKPMDNLTITPGVKYIDWSRSVAADPEQKVVPAQPYYAGYTTTDLLPFATVNYKMMPNWSAYFQYANRHLCSRYQHLRNKRAGRRIRIISLHRKQRPITNWARYIMPIISRSTRTSIIFRSATITAPCCATRSILPLALPGEECFFRQHRSGGL